MENGFISWRPGWSEAFFYHLTFLHCVYFQMEVKCVRIVLVSFCRRRAAAKRKKLKLVSGAGGGDGGAPPEEEEDPEEDSSLAGTGQDQDLIWQERIKDLL